MTDVTVVTLPGGRAALVKTFKRSGGYKVSLNFGLGYKAFPQTFGTATKARDHGARAAQALALIPGWDGTAPDSPARGN